MRRCKLLCQLLFYMFNLYCLFSADHGGDCESFCTVISAFAAQCQSLLKISNIKWRTPHRCPMQCDADKVYMTCGPLCPQTCFQNKDYGGCIANSSCVEGCFCPNGKVMNSNGQCIERNRCPCLHNHKIYPQNSRIIMKINDTCHYECECQNGSFVCDKTETTVCRRTNCTANQYRCQTDGQCIPVNWKCDQIEDCSDRSDELNIDCRNQCINKTNTFHCNNGQCIDAMHRCDGLPDCRDGSDEVNCCMLE